MKQIDVKNITFDYIVRDENDQIESSIRALEDLSMEVKPGDFIAVLGRNGSGKSTFAKMLNAILLPNFGDVIVLGMNTKEEDNLLEIRKNVGMVFQNPDNQIVANVVEEDMAFGPENLGIPSEEIVKRVETVSHMVGMEKFLQKSPNKLSGGQKQRVAIAGVLAMKPKCIVLDEPTAMLDPIGRRDIIETVTKLNHEEGITIIMITHFMEEAAAAKRVVVIDKNRIQMDGTPGEVFADYRRLKEFGLDVPQVTELAGKLKSAGIPLPDGIITVEELISELKSRKTGT
ncbi:MAG: energy-coupling factor transporter ATPase [Lachnospiraceae bacterium]|nr:energy-coupling factor transporter ATPase [Lachnospiraceae bacterium]